MNARWTELRFARRLLTLFVTSSLLPIAAVFVLSWVQVTGQLRDQGQQRLRQASKAVALTLLGRLQALDQELASFDPQDGLPTWKEQQLRERFLAVAVVGRDGSPRAVFGPAPDRPALGSEARASLEQDRPLLWMDDGGGLLLVRRAPRGDRSPALLLAAVNPPFVFDLSESSVLPPAAHFCAFSERGQRLACSGAAPPATALPAEPGGGAFEWSHDGETYLAHDFSLFLAGSFQAPPWRVVLSEPRSTVLAPVMAFRRTLPLVALLSVVFITLLCIRQIRARLGPLQALQEGTRRIARQDFAVDLRVESGDELQELAESFNAMARRLQGQFRALSNLVEMDRSILEASEEQGVVERVVRHLPGVYPCDAVAVIPIPEGSPGPEDEATAWCSRPGTDEVRRTAVRLPPPGVEPAGDDVRLVSLDDAASPWLEPLRAVGMRCAVVLPMIVQGREIGRVALGHREPIAEIPEDVVFAERVADQAAIAVRSIRLNEQNRALAYYDPLTRLPNRLLFHERVEQALRRAQRKGAALALCLLDLDGFKRVNDTWGHDAGDRLLEAFAQRILPLVRAGTLARLGGDEFTLLLPDVAHAEDAARVAERIIEALRAPFALGAQEVLVTASIGIAVHPGDGASLGALLKHADVAMYHAKDVGRNNYQFFSAGLNEIAARRMQLEQALRGALARRELRLVYQPIVDPVRRTIQGAEALLRWEHPELGAVPPSVFIPVAEETGLILPIGRWVLETALAEARAWGGLGSPIHVAINLSERQFRAPECAGTIRKAIRESGVSPDRVVLELTESTLVVHETETLRKLSEIRLMGVRLAIDDFGTGYSSFAYLKHFPIQILKLDKQFIRDLGTSRESDAITDAMIALGHKLGLQVVAEGVESEEQLAHLVGQGCDLVQGFGLGQPLEAEAFRDRLWERKRR